MKTAEYCKNCIDHSLKAEQDTIEEVELQEEEKIVVPMRQEARCRTGSWDHDRVVNKTVDLYLVEDNTAAEEEEAVYNKVRH